LLTYEAGEVGNVAQTPQISKNINWDRNLNIPGVETINYHWWKTAKAKVGKSRT